MRRAESRGEVGDEALAWDPTIAQASGSRMSQLVSYSDWGVPTFATVGSNSAAGFTGELGDSVTGLSQYFARAYDPWSASWLQADPYRGELTDPATLSRYAYVVGNPTTFIDAYGYCYQNYTTGQYQGSGCGGTRGYSKPPPKSTPPPGGSDPADYEGAETERHGPTCGLLSGPSCGETSATWNLLWTAAGLAGSVVAGFFLESLRGAVNGAASFGNAVLNNPDLLMLVLTGVLAIAGGVGGIGGGVALSATGVGAVAGVPAIIGSSALVTAGAATAGIGLAALGGEAAGDSRVEVWQSQGSGSSRGTHSDLRSTERGIDEEAVLRDGDLYIQPNGNKDPYTVSVLQTGSDEYQVVVRDPSAPPGVNVTAMRMNRNDLEGRLNDGRWVDISN